MPPKKLPADLDLMGYKELWDWITWEAIKEHWKKGGKLMCVKWGHPDFELEKSYRKLSEFVWNYSSRSCG